MAGDPWLRPRLPLDAYRADLSSMPQVATFGANDEVWLVVAELLSRRADALDIGDPSRLHALDATLDAALDEVHRPPAGRPRPQPSAQPAPTSEPPGDASRELRIADAVLRLADVMEESGALQLAFGVLSTLEHALPRLGARHRGLVAAARARTARMAGATDTADGLYGEVERIGRAAGDRDLMVRSLLGRAVLARRRGNYPESRVLYRRALRIAESAGARTLAGLAHHGLLIAASAAGEVVAALVHGGKALELFTDDLPRQADLLGTLGAVGSAAGFYDAALRAYLGAARRSEAARVRLPALAGAALCAAHLADAGLLTDAAHAVERDLAGDALPFERAQALTLLAEAWAVGAPATGGEPYTSRARAAACAGGYHELVAQVEAIGVPGAGATPAARAEAAVPARARRVLRDLEQLDAHTPHLVLAACA